MYPLSLKAYAKINLTLEVLGRRPDGYHQVLSVMQSVDLADTLTFAHSSRLELEGDQIGASKEDNLVYRAARLLEDVAGRSLGARICLRKVIPLASGLGGGSSNAATTIKGLNALWDLGMDSSELHVIAQELGSDVPFFLYGGTALAENRGDVVSPLPDLPRRWVVLLCPFTGMPGKTGLLYSSLSSKDFSHGDNSRALVRDLEMGRLTEEYFHNAFNGAINEVFPGLEGARMALQQHGGRAVHLSGSGPSIFSVFMDEAKAHCVANAVRASGFDAHVAQTMMAEESRL